MRMSASSLLDAIDCRVRVLSEKLDPGLLGARIVLGGFDEIEESDERLVEPIGKCLVGDLAVGGEKAWWACASENMSGYTRAPRCSSGTRRAQRPRLPPTIDGDAEISIPCFALNGCGLYRDTQSIAFFRTPGNETLYSGAAITNASTSSSRLRNCSAPGGKPVACASWL
jgi:hypothetical protein